ncbi:unnamed protein product, partial [Didymodactylos carnosus]
MDYTSNMNIRANTRDYVMPFITDLPITTIDSIKLQAMVISELTGTTSELTRSTAILASKRCNQLGNVLSKMVQLISMEDAVMAAENIATCSSNVLVGVNAPLLERSQVLDSDYQQANSLPLDYDTDIEQIWSDLRLFAEYDDFSTETIEKNRNIYYQQQTADDISIQVEETLSMITNVLSYHMNVGQKIEIET